MYFYDIYESYSFAKFDLKFDRLSSDLLEAIAATLNFGTFRLGPDTRKFIVPDIARNVLHLSIEMQSVSNFDTPGNLKNYIRDMFELGQVYGIKVHLVGDIEVVDNLWWNESAARDWLRSGLEFLAKEKVA